MVYLIIWQATDEDGSGMDDRSLRDELMTLLVAVRNLVTFFEIEQDIGVPPSSQNSFVESRCHTKIQGLSRLRQ